MKRIVIAALAAAVLAGAGVVAYRVARTKDRRTSASRQRASDASTAEAEAIHLLGLIRVPPRATAASCSLSAALKQPPFMPASDHLIDKSHCWRVPMPFDAAVGWVRSHPPRGLTSTIQGNGSEASSFGYEVADGASYRDAAAQVSIAPISKSVSLIRGDGLAVWISSTPTRDTNTGPRIRVTVATGCPRSLGTATDVRNDFIGRDRMLIPKQDATGGILCAYGPIGDKTRTVRRIALDATAVARLSRSIRGISLGSAGLTIEHCPMDQGETDIVVFHYRSGSDVDLWFHPSGCRFVANGSVVGGEIGNPSFGAFSDQITALTR